MRRYVTAMLFVFLLIISGCNKNIIVNNEENTKYEKFQNDSKENDVDKKETGINNIKENNINLDDIKPNENGQIMILMYHGIGDEESEWVRTTENFKKDLETLFNNGYRLLSLNDYINNDINIDAGFTPVILTFDDGLQNQFNYINDNGINSIDPNCAVGIIEEFYKNHPDFGRTAVFYVYYPVPFRQKDFIYDKYKFLIENGYEIGNHGYNHENLGIISIDKVQESLSKNAQKTNSILNGYKVQSLALPYGAAPKGENYKYVVSGEYNGFSYYNKAVLKVGSNPAYSPNHKKFDFIKIPRVRASEILVKGTGLYDYIEYFKKNPDKRYISDGNKDTITIPECELVNINMSSISNKELITYNQKDNKDLD